MPTRWLSSEKDAQKPKKVHWRTTTVVVVTCDLEGKVERADLTLSH